MFLKLIIPAFCNAVLAVILYLAEKRTAVGRLGFKSRQCAVGVLFGALAVFSSEYGVDIGGAVMNVRDASPLCAGLIFGAPSGIIAGLIGGAYRWFSVYWGAGTYTRLACSVSAVLSGLIAAVLRKYMFDDKKPQWTYALGIAMICEIIHMLMIFLTNMNDASNAFVFVQKATLPMVLTNGFAVGIAVAAVSLLSRERLKIHKEQKQIAQTFQTWLFVCIVIAYAATSTFTYFLQTGMSQRETETVIALNLNDVHNEITDASDENLLRITRAVKRDYIAMQSRGDIKLDELCKRFEVAGINIIDSKGIITASTLSQFVGYDMASGSQSAEFLVLLNGEDEFVQAYQPVSYDETISRKYAGAVLPDGGFIQVGYDAKQFRRDIDSQVIGVTKNRHIGNNGFIIICDEDMNIVIESSDYSGEKLSTIGIELDTIKMAENTVFETNIYDEPYLCAYTFAEGYYIIGAMPKSEALFMRNVSVYVSIFMEIIIFAVLFVLIYFLIKRVVIDNIRKINDSLAQITDGNLNVTVDVRTNEEFASLSDDINSTVSTLKRYIDEAAARIDKELEFAKQIQYSALPSVFPPYPNRKDFDIYAQMFTAKEVGGDFYDFYMLNDSTLAFLIADVSGKGIPAAMFMMRAKTIIKDLAESGIGISEIFTKANAKLCENNDAGMFITAWMGILDLKTGLMKFANAGHNPPLVRRANGEYEYMKARSGLVLAGMDGLKYRENELQLMPGDQIYLYTDGVTEATDIDERLYGEERLLGIVNSGKESDSQQLCTLVKADVDSFVGDAPQFDDITMVSVRFNFVRNENSVTVMPDKASFAVVQGFAEEFVEKVGIPVKVSNKINIIVDEIYSNIVNYSGADSATLSCAVIDGKLHMTFTDNGIAYNPLDAEEPDITQSAEERKIGGLGIFMTKKMTESMEYERKDDKNVLTLVMAIGV